MAKTTINENGHIVYAADSDALGSGTAGEDLTVGDVVYLKSADSKLWIYASNSDALCGAIVGLATGTFAAEAAATFYQSGDVASGLSGLTAGTEYWAKSDGTLATFGSLASGDFTRPMGVSLSTSSLQMQIGGVIQK